MTIWEWFFMLLLTPFIELGKLIKWLFTRKKKGNKKNSMEIKQEKQRKRVKSDEEDEHFKWLEGKSDDLNYDEILEIEELLDDDEFF